MRLETFFDNFELLADAPNGVQQLRELIWQLAVQGKLVPQDPNDTPASVLLEKIKAEKEGLAKEKKIRKPTALPLVEPNKIPFDVPQSWRWVRLGEIGQIVGGGTPRTEHPEYYADNGVPWLTPADLYGLEEKFIGRGKKDISILGLKKSSAQLIPTGTVLFSSRAPIGYVAIAENDLSTNQGFKSCIPFIMQMNEYIYYFFKFAAKQINDNASGTTFKEVSGKEVSLILFPVPPLEEQKRIVAKVDQLISLCDDLEARQRHKREGRVRLNTAALDQLLTTREPDAFTKHWQRICDNFDLLYSAPENIGKLRQAILQLAVQGKLVPQDLKDEPASVLIEKIKAEKEWLIQEGKIRKSDALLPIKVDEVPYRLPEGWEWVRLGELGCFLGGGTPSKSNQFFWQGKIPWVSPKDMKTLYISDVVDHISEEALEQSSVQLIPQRSLLLVFRGMILAHSFPVALSMREVTINQDMKALQILVPAISEYLLRACRALELTMLKKVARSSHGTCRLDSKDVAEFPIPLPPLTEQKRIVAKLNQLMALCDKLEAKLTQSQADSEALMDAAVRQVLAV